MDWTGTRARRGCEFRPCRASNVRQMPNQCAPGGRACSWTRRRSDATTPISADCDGLTGRPVAAILRRVAERYGPKAALIVVDVQNDFADPGGSLFVQSAADILPMVNSEARIAAEAGAFVVYTQDWHPGVDAALREGRRHLAGPLRRRDVGRGVPPDAERRRPIGQEGHERRGRLLRRSR